MSAHHGVEEALMRASAHGEENVARYIVGGEVDGHDVPRADFRDCQALKKRIDAGSCRRSRGRGVMTVGF
jgi:hypothetical protein